MSAYCLFCAMVGPGLLRSLCSKMGGRGVHAVGCGGSGVVESLVGCCPCGSSLLGYIVSQCRLGHQATLSTCVYARVR